MSSTSPEEVDSELRLWSPTGLREYLLKRCLPISGDKDLLISRVFSAWENNVPVQREGEDSLRLVKEEYKAILKRINIDDPLLIQSGWIDEEHGGSAHWPCLGTQQLLEYHEEKKHWSGYKWDKAFQYYRSGLTQNVSFHKLSDVSDRCILLNSCTRSMEKSKEPHEAWVCLCKKSAKVLGAYCSCLAGLSEACNHISALLFKVEELVKDGRNVGTANLCTWKAGGKGKGAIEVRIDRPIEEVLTGFNRATYSKPTRKHPLLSEKRASFMPLTPLKESELEDVRSQYVKMLASCQSNASVLGALTRSERVEVGLPVPGNPPDTEDDASSSSTPEHVPTIQDLWKRFCEEEDTDPADMAHNFSLLFLPEYFSATPEIVMQIRQDTIRQARSPIWAEQRQHRLTASNFGLITKRMEKIQAGTAKRDQLTFCRNLFKAAKFHGPNLPPSLAWGVNHEEDGLRRYAEQNAPHHQNLSVQKVGLLVDRKLPFVGATPDGLVLCECHEARAVEIKCPYSLRDHDPNINTPDFVERNGLKRGHPYFLQVQGQMALLGCKQCDVLIWTPKGCLQLTIDFDLPAWEEAKKKLSSFYVDIYVPLMLQNKTSESVMVKFKKTAEKPTTKAGPRKFNTKKRGRPSKKVQLEEDDEKVQLDEDVVVLPSEFKCPVCDGECLDTVQLFGENSIACDFCGDWFHYACVGIVSEDRVPRESEPWFCSFHSS